jgi:adenylate cyclase
MHQWAHDKSYSHWRHRFMMRRLRLAIWFGLLYFLSFLPLDIVNYVNLGRNQLDLLWIGVNLVRIGALLGCWGLLQRCWHRDLSQPSTQRYLAVVFLVASWSLSLLHRFYGTYAGFVTGNLIGDPDLFSWALLFITQATLIPVRWPLHLLSQGGVLLYYFGINPLLGFQVVPPDVAVANTLLNVFWICCICNCSVYFYEKLSAANFHANRQLAEAQDRSERLLLNILPSPIAEKLKYGPRTIAENFSEVTVLFADLVNFTQMADGQEPEVVVDLLNQVFSRFDQLAEQHQLEKIKTIGDAYMVVAGLPTPRTDHAEAMATMALEMQATLHEFNQDNGYDLSIRIGIHTGPVVAGVIGLKKFAYDLWGDTVNTASRMESHGLPGVIQVSDMTYRCLKDTYRFEPRGPLEIKGKGLMMTYLLQPPRSDRKMSSLQT